MSAWTIKMNILDKPNSFCCCRDNNIIGVGWGLADETIKPDSVEAYKKLRTSPMTRQLSIALGHMDKMQEGDIVWTLDSSNTEPTYHLCKLTSGYQYFDKEIQDICGIANGFYCEYHPVKSEEMIPDNVIRLLNGKGLIYHIDNEKEINMSYKILEIINELAAIS